MSYEIIVGAVIAAIALLLMIMRANAGVVFFSICAGSVLATQLGNEASLISSIVVKDGDLNKSIVYIALIVLPALLSTIFLRGSIAPSKALFNLFPSVAVGALLTLLVIPLLPQEMSAELLDSSVWGTLQDYQPIILVGGVLSSIALLWITHKTGGHHKKHKK